MEDCDCIDCRPCEESEPTPEKLEMEPERSSLLLPTAFIVLPPLVFAGVENPAPPTSIGGEPPGVDVPSEREEGGEVIMVFASESARSEGDGSLDRVRPIFLDDGA
jgi:hypothetical protein